MNAQSYPPRCSGLLSLVVAVLLSVSGPLDAIDAGRHAVPDFHPRLLGTRAELRDLARQRPEAYERTKRVAEDPEAPDPQRLISLGLVSAIEEDALAGRKAIEIINRYVRGGAREGHVPFGHDVALGALVFDLCYEHWTNDERRELVAYLNATAKVNEGYGASVFHNGWWGYKNWGLGIGAYATYHENEQARTLLKTIETDYLQRAAPALKLAGDGGGWAEGYYIHYFLYEWLFFCEIARRSEGVDYHQAAPEFYRERAVASMFEMYPGLSDYQSRQPVPMGDGGGRVFGGDRDKALSARRILVNRYREDPDHQVAHTYNEQTPRSSIGANAYKDFLWRDESITPGNLKRFRLSHHSAGVGHIHARSDWSEAATYFFFKASDRFTSHQHLDAGHFLIYRHAELVGDGGHYDGFGTPHDVNYHLRTIAHNTLLIRDPQETWPAIRGGTVTGNDGGQHHRFPHHNGAVNDPKDWQENRTLYDLVDVLAVEEMGEYHYVAADLTRAYAPEKLAHFSRQIVYLRPSTFVILDRVTATSDSFEKTWVLQAMRAPVRSGNQSVISHAEGRLFHQCLLPEQAVIKVHIGAELYGYDGSHYSPERDTGPAPQTRLQVSPTHSAKEHLFLNVLRATGLEVDEVTDATVASDGDQITVTVDGRRITFSITGEVGYGVDAE